jgi:hypothetical protein
VLGLIGNVRALAARRHYLARDMNRLWKPAYLPAVATPIRGRCRRPTAPSSPS